MRLTWILVGLAMAFLLLAAREMWPWALDPDNALELQYWGLQLSIFGVFGTVIGFIVAFQQLQKSRSASEAANDALTEIRAKLSTLSASGEIERARYALEEAQRHLHDNRLRNARPSIVAARQSFVRIVELDLVLFSDLADQLRASVTEMAALSDKLDESDKDDRRHSTGLVRGYLDLTDRMQVRMTRG